MRTISFRVQHDHMRKKFDDELA